YHPALLRYFRAFPRERIHVFLFDDLKRNPRAVVQDVYRFLDIDPGHVPDLDTPYNTGGLPANRLLERIFNLRSLKQAVEPWLPQAAMKRLRRLRAANLHKAPPLPPEIRAHLGTYFRDDILRTAELLERPLDHWLSPAPLQATPEPSLKLR